jgi:hypothetical protein
MAPPLTTRCWVDDIPEHPPKDKAKANTTIKITVFFISIASFTES